MLGTDALWMLYISRSAVSMYSDARLSTLEFVVRNQVATREGRIRITSITVTREHSPVVQDTRYTNGCPKHE